MCDHPKKISNTAIPLGYIKTPPMASSDCDSTKVCEKQQEQQYSVETVVDESETPLECSNESSSATVASVVIVQDQSKAIVPLSSTLPSKILRLNARRNSQQRAEMAMEKDDEEEEGEGEEDNMEGACALSTVSEAKCCLLEDEFVTMSSFQGTAIAPNTSPASSISPAPPSPQSFDSGDEKLIDVGMGSSIECSDESAEEDDELKPLAVDNHTKITSMAMDNLASPSGSPTVSVLSEVNLEKFRHHHHHHHHHYNHATDNIYYHPNYNFEMHASMDRQKSPPNGSEASGDVNANNDDIETAANVSSNTAADAAAASAAAVPLRVHRSFLTISKKQLAAVDLDLNENNATTASMSSGESSAANSIDIQSTQAAVNEIDTLDPSDIPDDELSADITEQVEFYFSNDSILKDAFLLKHVRRNKEGFVSLKLVSSFKRVRQLTKDWKVVGYAVRRMSKKIELNDLGTKVRRIEPLPNFDETMPSRTIVACDLPFDKLTIEKVSDIFAKCGEIALIRILKPGMAIPVDVRQFMNKYPEMQQKECALVEFVDSTSAREAKSLVGSFQVYDMVAPKKKTGKKATTNNNNNNNINNNTIPIAGGAPVAKMVENYRLQENNYERARGGSFSGVLSSDTTDMRYKLRRNHSSVDYHSKMMPITSGDVCYHHQHHHLQQQHPSYQSHHSQPQMTHYQSRNSISSQGVVGHDLTEMSPPIGGGGGVGGGNMNFYASSPRRYSNASAMTSASSSAVVSEINNTNNNNNAVRRFSNCSDTYSTCSEISRRPSNCSETAPASRRNSTCSENCPCSRRVSQCTGTAEAYRKLSQGSSDFSSSGPPPQPRRGSNGSFQFERTYSNPTEMLQQHQMYSRRMSNDFNMDRKQSNDANSGILYENDGNVGGGGGGYNVFRRYSNNFDPNRKLSNYDQYINGRRISTDSGYDRRYSFGSDFEGSPRSRTGSFLNSYKNNDYDGSPRSRTGSFLNSYKSGEFDGSPRSRSGSFLNAHKNAENLVRTPIGPDGSRGFGSRARKFGHIIAPVN